MTVNSEDTPRVQYTANSITTIFPITFVYDDISDVHVYFISNSTGLATAWTKDASGPTGYTVSAGAIVANTAPSNGYLVAVCTTTVTQLVDVKPNRALTADTLEGVFDKLTLIGRDLKGSVSRALIYGPTYTGSIPYAEDLADEIKQDSVDASVAAVNALTFATSLHIDNLAALRLFPGGETTSIYLDCYTSNGDGGHGTFYWDATSTDADDGQDTIAVTGVSVGRWKRNIDPITGELSTHINRTTVHGSTDAPTAGRIVQRDVNGCSSFAPGTEQSHAVVLGQLAEIILSQIVSSFDGDISGTNSGWLKLPGGLIIQWGKNKTASTENTWIVHDFPIPFPTTAFVIVGTGTDASVNLDPAIRINIYGLGQFRIWNTGYTSKYVNWIALGYGAPAPDDDYSDIIFWDGFDGALVDPVYTATDLDYPPRHTWYVRVANNSRLAQEYAMVGATALYLRLYSYRVYAEIPPMSTQRGRVGCWVRPVSALHGIVALTGGDESYAWSISLRTAPAEYGKITLDGRLDNNGFGGVWTLPEPIIELTPYYIELGWDFPLGYFDLWINGNYMGRVEYTSKVAGTFGYVSVGVNPMITNYVDAAYDNVIVSTDPNRDLYALALLEACPRV